MKSRHAELNYEYPFCEGSATAEKAFHVLTQHVEDLLPEPDIEGTVRLRHLVITYLYSLDSVSRCDRIPRFSQRFHGFEALDIIKQPKFFRLKTGNASSHLPQLGSLGGWTKLIAAIDVILFFEGIEDPIVPAAVRPLNRIRYICPTLTRMPASANNLASTVESLRCLWKDSSCGSWHRLAENAYWNRADKLFEECECSLQSCRRMQTIWPIDNANPPNARHLDRYSSGAVIFASGTGLWSHS